MPRDFLFHAESTRKDKDLNPCSGVFLFFKSSWLQGFQSCSGAAKKSCVVQVAGVAVGLKTACDLHWSIRYHWLIQDLSITTCCSYWTRPQVGPEKSAPTAARGCTLIDDITFMAPGGVLKRTSDLLPSLTESVWWLAGVCGWYA